MQCGPSLVNDWTTDLTFQLCHLWTFGTFQGVTTIWTVIRHRIRERFFHAQAVRNFLPPKSLPPFMYISFYYLYVSLCFLFKGWDRVMKEEKFLSPGYTRKLPPFAWILSDVYQWKCDTCTLGTHSHVHLARSHIKGVFTCCTFAPFKARLHKNLLLFHSPLSSVPFAISFPSWICERYKKKKR